MEDKEQAVQTKFHSFLQQRNNKTNVSMQGAQRLINLYRVLHAFGPDFVDEYNQMLKSSSDEVQMALKALVGGQEVRQYLEFLQSEDHKDENNAENGPQQAGWLPSAESEKGDNAGVGEYVSVATWQNFVKEQDEKFTKLMGELRSEQNEVLKRLTDQLSVSLRAQRPVSPAPPPKAAETTYSEIIEEKK